MYTVSLHHAERDARHLREAAEVIEARLKDRDHEVVSLSAKISELKDRVNEVCIIVLHFLALIYAFLTFSPHMNIASKCKYISN